MTTKAEFLIRIYDSVQCTATTISPNDDSINLVKEFRLQGNQFLGGRSALDEKFGFRNAAKKGKGLQSTRRFQYQDEEIFCFPFA